MRGCAFIVNTKGDLSRTEPRIAEILKYIDVGETNNDNEVIKRMCEAKDKAFNKEDWTSDMNETDFDRLAWKAEGREENRAEGIATDIAEDRTKKRIAERAREAALLETMNARGRDTSEFVNAVANGDLDILYKEYSIE